MPIGATENMYLKKSFRRNWIFLKSNSLKIMTALALQIDSFINKAKK